MRSAVVLGALAIVVAGCAQPPPDIPHRSPTEAGSLRPAPPSAPDPTEGSAPSSASERARPPRSVSINVSGDLLWHDLLWASAAADAAASGAGGMDFLPMLASLEGFVSSADVAICHSEVPFATQEGPFENYPRFAAPPQIAPALAEVGWDLCTTASNHTLDQGWEGLVRTVDVHRAAGLVTVGSYRTEEEANAPVIVETTQGVEVCVVSQTYGLNGLQPPADKPWAVDLIDPDDAIAGAERCRAEGADIVAVHLHAGTEYEHEPNQQQRDFAQTVTASDHVDFVFGQHAHVVQPIDKVNDKWVVYGAGNLVAQSGPGQPHTYDGYMAEVTFTESSEGFVATGMRWAPTMITKHTSRSPARVHFIPDAKQAEPALAVAMEQSAARTRAVVTSRAPEGLTEVS